MRFRIVNQSTVLVIEKFGKFDRIAESGIQWIRFGEVIVNEIDLRTRTLDTEKQRVITKDNVSMEIDAVVYFRVTDPYKATYKVDNYLRAMTYLTQTTLRNEIAKMDMEQALSSKEEMNKRINASLDAATDEWGVKVERVEIKDMLMPREIQDAMEKQMKAEREKREKILLAQGKKEAAIMEAEGKKESSILNAQAEKESSLLRAQAAKEAELLRAEGEAQSIEMVAQAEAKRIEHLLKALKNADVDEKVLTLKSIEALVEMAKGDNKVFIPYETSGILGNVGAIKELIQTNDSNNNQMDSQEEVNSHLAESRTERFERAENTYRESPRTTRSNITNDSKLGDSVSRDNLNFDNLKSRINSLTNNKRNI